MSTLRFEPRASFELTDARYRLLPFRFMRWHDGTVLVTNECGEFEFLAGQTFEAFTNHALPQSEPHYADLKAKHFLADSDSTLPVRLLATKVRTKREFLTGFTRLHIFVTTLRCDHTCPYCQVSRVTEDRTRFDMSLDTATRATAWMFKSPAQDLKVEFQGGEPTLNWPVIEHVVRLTSERALAERRSVEFVIATNLSAISDDMLAFCKDHRIQISTSLDGPPDLHNANRPRPGKDSFERFARTLERARAALGHGSVSALMTATPRSLGRVTEIIDQYVALGFDSVFLRPISPYGFATRTRLDRAYDSADFLNFYREGLDHIIALNRRGTPILETYAQILLRKILTPFAVGYVDLQSPAGAAIGALVYNYDGGVYASDESRMLAEMGDQSFRLGHLAHDRYEDVMRGVRVRALVESSCLETTPGCTECAFAPYCGSDPVFNWATQGDVMGYRPTSQFCSRQMGLFTDLLDRLRGDDPFVVRLFLAWAANA